MKVNWTSDLVSCCLKQTLRSMKGAEPQKGRQMGPGIGCQLFSTWNIFTWYIFPPGIFFALNFVETFFSGTLRIGGQLCFFQKDKCNISVSVFDLILNKDDDMRLTIQKTKRRKRRAGTTILDFKCLRFPAKRNPNGCYQLYAVWHTVYVDIVLTQCWWWKIIWEWKKGFFPCQLKRGSKVVAQSRHGRHCWVLVGRTGVIWNWNQLRRQWFQTEDWRGSRQTR